MRTVHTGGGGFFSVTQVDSRLRDAAGALHPSLPRPPALRNWQLSLVGSGDGRKKGGETGLQYIGGLGALLLA